MAHTCGQEELPHVREIVLSVSLITIEMQIKTTRRYQLIPVRTDIINNLQIITLLLVGTQTGATTMENSIEVP